MITISLCMIVKNEEDVIGNCLESVKDVVDEINIVDTGSTDRTKEIVGQYTDRIFDFEWIDDFAAARNYSFEQATKDYILWLDSDDVLLPEDAAKLLELKKALERHVDCVTFKYNYASDEKGNPVLIFRRERLVRRDRNFKWVGFIHEYIGGDKYRSEDVDITVTHRRIHGSPDRNLNIYRKKLSEGVKLSNRDIYYYGKELYYHSIHEEALEVLGSLLDVPIWIEEKIDIICKMSDSYVSLGRVEDAKQILLRAFRESFPRGEVIFRLGQIYETEGKYQEALYWYESTQYTKMPQDMMGFTYLEYWTWKPALQACLCYHKLGDMEKSYLANERAYAFKPTQEALIQNKAYFKSIGYE